MSEEVEHYWIWPRASSVGVDRSLRFKTSGVDRGEVHWTAEESFGASDPMHPAMNWVYQNRGVLPSLIGRQLVPNDLDREAALMPLPDGVYSVLDERLTAGWSESLGLPITAVALDRAPQTLRVILQLTGGNCLLFRGGVCEATISVADEPTDESVTPQQGLWFLKSLISPATPDSKPSPTRG